MIDGFAEGVAVATSNKEQSPYMPRASSEALDEALRPLRKTSKAVAKLARALSSKDASSSPPKSRRRRAQALSDPSFLLLTDNDVEPQTLKHANTRIQHLEELIKKLQTELDSKDAKYKHRMTEISDILASLSRRISMACDKVVKLGAEAEDQ